MTRIQGWFEREFAPVNEAFARNFEEYGELGASVCIYMDGQEKVHLWGGSTGGPADEQWSRDTLIEPASVCKGLLSFCVHKLVSDGRLGYEDPIVRWWPEFGVHGKDALTVRHLLGQTAGLEKPFPIDPLGVGVPLAQMLPAMEAAVPVSAPGKHGAYHSQTLMPLLAGLCYKVTGEEVHRYFRREIAGPWGIDAYVALPVSEHRRAGTTVVRAGSYYHKMLSPLIGAPADQDIRLAPQSRLLLPYATARALARLWGGFVSDGMLDEVRLFSAEVITAAAQVQWRTADWYPIQTNKAYGGVAISGTLGFFAADGPVPMGPNPRSFGSQVAAAISPLRILIGGLALATF